MPRNTRDPRKPAALLAALVLTLTLGLALATAPAAHAAPADRGPAAWWSALWHHLAGGWPGGSGLISLAAPEGGDMDPNGAPAAPAGSDMDPDGAPAAPEGSSMDPNGTVRPQAGGDMDPNG